MNRRIAFIGAGNMASAIIGGILQSGLTPPENICAANPTEEKLRHLRETFGIRTEQDNRRAAEGAELLFLCVKPQMMDGVLQELLPVLSKEQTVVSVAAASTLFVAMTMAVMVAAAGCGGFNIVLKRAGDERGDGSITVAFVAGIKTNVGLCQRLHGSRSEAAADHAVYRVLYEKVHHGGVTVAAGGNRFGRNDGSVLHNIDLEVGRHAEVLEDGVVFDGHRDFHM